MNICRILPVLLTLPVTSHAAYVLTNGDFSTNDTTGWTSTGTVNAASGAAVMSASSSLDQDFSNGATGTAENFSFQLDFTFLLIAVNQNQRIRIRDNSNAVDIITLRFNNGTGMDAFDGIAGTNTGFQNALAFTLTTNTTYFFRLIGVDLDLVGRTFALGLSSDGINYTSTAPLTFFHSAPVGSDFETLRVESGASTTMTIDNIIVVPEPTTSLLGGLGVLGLLRRRRN